MQLSDWCSRAATRFCASLTVRIRLRVDGVVQGVGFRPFAYRLANELALAGFVHNDALGVTIEVQGSADTIDRFEQRLQAELPPLAHVDNIVRELINDGSFDEHADNRFPPSVSMTEPHSARFIIVDSDTTSPQSAQLSPDIATCDECLAEIMNPANRRYRYPFTNCTNCGPRFTIIRAAPYDRSRTTMSVFAMCHTCQAEYDNPLDRRFHAQPNACPDCGPQVRLVRSHAPPIESAKGSDAIDGAIQALMKGEIVAIKGVGGYHIACRADDYEVVAKLRQRKARPHKPFAVMVPNLAWAERVVALDSSIVAILAGMERPIVLGRSIRCPAIADNVAPALAELGVMLPYSPLHHLLLHMCDTPLVMTSGNLADEPIAFRDADALERLAGIADVFVLHNREIETPTDDSVVRVLKTGNTNVPIMIRRSRGYAPTVFQLPVAAPPLVACGAQLKNTYCIAAGHRAWLGPHVGDLGNAESRDAFERGIQHHEELFSVRPFLFAHDLHPDYASTSYALSRAEHLPSARTVAVQHHHAHFAACLAEHGENGNAAGVIFDGTGLGTDNTLWGGEILFGNVTSAKRVAHLWPVAQPGGEAAIHEPWRMACAWLTELHTGTFDMPATIAAHITPAQWRTAIRVARNMQLSPRTTSAGRLLDALAALCGVRMRVTYEGQAAIELEALADAAEILHYSVPIQYGDGPAVIDVRALIHHVVNDIAHDIPVSTVSAKIHNAIAIAIADCCAQLFSAATPIVLSGGVFQNALLLKRAGEECAIRGFRTLLPQRVPPNDGGIAYGQAVVASASAAR